MIVSTPVEAHISHPQEAAEHSHTADETQTHNPLRVPSPAEDSHTPRPQTGSGESVTREQARDRRHDHSLPLPSTTLTAQQLPPIPKYTGETTDVGGETIQDWLEQLDMVATVCHWDQPTKLVNLVTRLRGQAFAFYRTCTPDQRGSYEALKTELLKRFTPV